MNIEISDAPIIPITCSTNSCKDSIFTYQAPIECDDYEWVISQPIFNKATLGLSFGYKEV